MADAASGDWELQPVGQSPFASRVELPPGGDLYRGLTPEQLQGAGGPGLSPAPPPTLAQALGNKAQELLEQGGASRGYSQDFGHKLGQIAAVAPVVGDLSSAQEQAQQGNALGATLPVLGMFLGPGARLANLGKLEAAKTMLAAGHDAEAVRAATGWHQGVDKGWRFEIPDSSMSVDMGKIGTGNFAGRVVTHNALFQNYPELRSFAIKPVPTGQGYSGYFDSAGKEIGLVPSSSQLQNDLTVAHELQHAVQNIEGWEPGTSPSWLQKNRGLPKAMANAAYFTNAGEVEARNTERRLDMSAAARKAISPDSTQSVTGQAQWVSASTKPKGSWSLEPVEHDPFGGGQNGP